MPKTPNETDEITARPDALTERIADFLRSNADLFDNPSGQGIEITPEMIEAGMLEYYTRIFYNSLNKDIVCAVYRAMHRVAPCAVRASSESIDFLRERG